MNIMLIMAGILSAIAAPWYRMLGAGEQMAIPSEQGV